jgi:hypothetical protein
MLPELLRFSSAARLLAQIPEAQQAHHRVDRVDRVDRVVGAVPMGGSAMKSLWSGWGDVAEAEAEAEAGEAMDAPPEAGTSHAAEDMDDDALDALGL